jgi:putative ABC transport system permease protein
MLIALFAQNELSYDSQQPDAERVYRINQDFGTMVLPLFNYTQAKKTLKNSQVEDILSIEMVENSKKVATAVKYQGQGYNLGFVYGATPNIEQFININTVSGDLKEALSTPNSLALNESEALRIFGQINVIGEVLTHEKGQYIVRAVFEDLSENTHFGFKTLSYLENDPTKTDAHFSYIYVKLAAQSDPDVYAKMLTEQSFTGDNKGKRSLHLIPLRDLHLTAKSMAEFKKGGEKQGVMICLGLSALLILIVSFNFINMTVAQSTKRAKEVGVRKALGASKSQLVAQFMSESVLISMLATIIACTFVELSLPSFNALVDRELVIKYSSLFGVVILAVSILVGTIAGLYPAFFISSFSAKRVLNGDLQHGNMATLVRKGLLVLQAAISIALIITTVNMSLQLDHLKNQPLGYEKKQRLVISELPVGLVYAKDMLPLIDRLNNIEGVQQLTVMGFNITKSTLNFMPVTWPNGEKADGNIPVTGAGFNIVGGLGLTLLAGRDFSPEFASDWNTQVYKPFKRDISAIVTESLAKQAGYNNIADIIGKTISNTNPKYASDMRVVGVVADVTVGSGQNAEASFMFLCGYPGSLLSEVVLTIDSQKSPYIQHQIIKVMGEHANIFEPKISLLAENYKALFRSDERVSQLVTIFATLAIFLTMLGTFGLASFATLRRQKEVAMRKVLGASRLSIVNLLAKEFLLLMVVSVAIAYPITFWLVGDWLANFNERIEQAIWVYIAAAVCITLLTWLTVASLAFKVASARPSLILRDE